MVTFRTMYNYERNRSFEPENTEPHLTLPDQVPSIKQLYQMMANGQPLPPVSQDVHYLGSMRDLSPDDRSILDKKDGLDLTDIPLVTKELQKIKEQVKEATTPRATPTNDNSDVKPPEDGTAH